MEKLVETWSDLVVDPTLTAEEIQAGAASALIRFSLPEEITVAIPSSRSMSMILFLIAFTGSASHCATLVYPILLPILILTAAME